MPALLLSVPCGEIVVESNAMVEESMAVNWRKL